MLALGAHYLRALDAAGISVDDAAGLVEFRLAASDDQFVTIAKLRAVRRMWARMLELSGASEDHRNMSLHAVTSRPMMTKHDPWVNMLRTCVAAFAAGVGGADAVTVLPFDARLGLPDAFAAGSRATPRPCWSRSRTSPRSPTPPVARSPSRSSPTTWPSPAGRSSAGSSRPAESPTRSRTAPCARGSTRSSPSATGRSPTRTRPLTGLTEFPNLHETLPERKPYAEGALPVRPYGEPFEALRDEPAATKVFLATMGTIAAHTARASFATNLFAAGGIDVVNAGRHDDVEAVLKDYEGPDGGQSVVCLVGTTRRTPSGAPTSSRRSARPAPSGSSSPASRVEGVETDDTCAMGVDALEFLHRTREKLADGSEVSIPGELRRPAARRRGHREGARRGRDVGVAGGHRHPADLRPRAPRGPRRAGHLPGPGAVPPRALPDDVHHPAVDHPPVRRVLDRRGVQRLLPPQPGCRPEGPLGRLRPGHPPRLRLRPPAGEG